MNITSLASMASTMRGQEINQQISMAVYKQIQDQQEQQATAMVQMIQQSNAVVNGHVDTYA